jgi:CXXC-20-CXXC protein
MSHRECPNCSYKYSGRQYFKKFYFKFIWQSWPCEKCGTPIKFDLKRRLFLAFLLGITLLGIFQIKDIINNKLMYFSISVLILFLIGHTLFLFDKFILSKK